MRAHRLPATGSRHDLADVAAEEARHRCERAEESHLLPEVLDDVVGQPPFDGGARERLRDRLDARGLRPVALPEEDAIQGIAVPHDAVGPQHRVDVGRASQDLRGAETRVERLEMREPVQDRKQGAAGVHRRRHRIHRRIEVVGLAGEEHAVVTGTKLLGEQRLHLELRVSGGTLDPQAVALELRAPLGPHQERHVGAALRQAPAEITAEAAGAEDEYLHGRSIECEREILRGLVLRFHFAVLIPGAGAHAAMARRA
jgi:hypothetical protein